MRLEISADQKVNLKQLEAELGTPVKVLEESRSETDASCVTTIYPWVFEVEDPKEDKDKMSEKELQAICDKHAPELSDREEQERKAKEAKLEQATKEMLEVFDILIVDKDFIKRLKTALEA